MKQQKRSTRTITHLNKSRPPFEGRNYKFVLAIVLFIAALILTFPYEQGAQKSSYPTVGEVSPKTIIAPYTFEVLKNDTLLRLEEQRLLADAYPVYTYDEKKRQRAQNHALYIFSQIDTILSFDSIEHKEAKSFLDSLGLFTYREAKALRANQDAVKAAQQQISSMIDRGIRAPMPETLPTPEDDRLLDKLRKNTIHRDIRVYTGDDTTVVSKDSLYSRPEVYDAVLSELPSVDQSKNMYFTSALYKIMDQIFLDTYTFEPAKTLHTVEEALEEIDSVKTKVIENVEIVRKHQRVDHHTHEILSTLQSMEEQTRAEDSRQQILKNISALLLLSLLSVLIITFLRQFIPLDLTADTYFLLLSCMTALQLFIIRGAYLFFPTLFLENSTTATTSLEILFNGVPMLVGVFLASMLFNRETGLLISVFFAVYLGIATEFNFISVIKILITGGIASHMAHSIRYRKDYLRIVLLLTLINTVVVSLAIYYNYELTPHLTMIAAAFAFSDVFFSVIITILLLPLIESRFSITTDMKLLELADMSHPLMKRLSIEAPGTYNHSILVANLAESASDEIGTNSLLCRVAAYYHDIGKLEKDPRNFIENQGNCENPHDHMPPHESARLIIDHVEMGVRLAKKHQLPGSIISAIQEHHGDACMQYFYNKALHTNPEEIPARETYYYTGPKPQTAETAILLLADSLEAASRSYSGDSMANLDGFIKKIIYEKIRLGLLEESTLTFDDIHKMTRGFSRILEGVSHNRR
ncbi:HDIG domain-containing metalloprotein [Chitinivibrio alkaliphilus]|uniref:7TM receptor with intracellular metal dependent phosphohydrolase n=1 Tax=Chitinivibrio alkaliphilus ACht1 TaxID=1313304 RepID=U7D8A1_9BACT|nr:HDIG domain-containing metalloprotein [Chitinivibrio alkaliphilus]ERP39185.1 7TM receptor with intracellular metal dependent phosphohydrolase [Chitinivibrio alkaliphilus ACht1]